MNREIGSEFWDHPGLCDGVGHNGDSVFLLSGRTAIDFIARDMHLSRQVRSVGLPAYCCESMIEPFVKHGLAVSFFDLCAEEAVLPEDCDAVLLLDYFGYEMPQTARLARLAHETGKVVIYDGTHKLSGNPAAEAFTDYSFCSYRKWFFCNSAVAVKHRGKFLVSKPEDTHPEYLRLRRAAAEKKKAYIQDGLGDKSEFLQMFRQAEEILDTDYACYSGEAVFPETGQIAARRRENAARLLEGLKQIPGVTPWRANLGEGDEPLFVPVLVDADLRPELRKHLISRHIYCPVHWPLSHWHDQSQTESAQELYTCELSLVCDQRYDAGDMDRLLYEIRQFFGGNG